MRDDYPRFSSSFGLKSSRTTEDSTEDNGFWRLSPSTSIHPPSNALLDYHSPIATLYFQLFHSRSFTHMPLSLGTRS